MARKRSIKGEGESRGIIFQVPPGWDDGRGKVQHMKSGPFKGRVVFTSERELHDLAKRIEDKEQIRMRVDDRHRPVERDMR